VVYCDLHVLKLSVTLPVRSNTPNCSKNLCFAYISTRA